MITSTIPLAEPLDWHPVHRAAALLRQGLLSSAATSPDPAEIWNDSCFCVTPAATDLSHGPVSITDPTSLATLLGLPSISDDGDASCQPPVTQANDPGAAVAPVGDASEGDGLLDRTTQLHLQSLVQAFYRRQRQASLLVACSIATAVALTLGGLVLLFSVTDRAPAKHEDAAPQDGTSVARAARRAALVAPRLEPVRVQANTQAKTGPLLIRAKVEPIAADQGPLDARVILATPQRPLALAPLLPLGSARYLLLRGLPEEAELSAGRRTGTGTWMVKGEDMPGLTLTLGNGANGDYPLEVYLLDASNGPQARRRLVLRVDQTPQFYAAGLSLGWPGRLPEVRQEPDATAKPATVPAAPIESGVLRERAQRLLGEGDLPAARRVLTQLAERGQADAAYELALTYDLEVLAKAGIRGVDGDPAIARAWYERAAREGHAGATQRLQTLSLNHVAAPELGD